MLHLRIFGGLVALVAVGRCFAEKVDAPSAVGDPPSALTFYSVPFVREYAPLNTPVEYKAVPTNPKIATNYKLGSVSINNRPATLRFETLPTNFDIESVMASNAPRSTVLLKNRPLKFDSASVKQNIQPVGDLPFDFDAVLFKPAQLESIATNYNNPSSKYLPIPLSQVEEQAATLDLSAPLLQPTASPLVPNKYDAILTKYNFPPVNYNAAPSPALPAKYDLITIKPFINVALPKPNIQPLNKYPPAAKTSVKPAALKYNPVETRSQFKYDSLPSLPTKYEALKFNPSTSKASFGDAPLKQDATASNIAVTPLALPTYIPAPVKIPAVGLKEDAAPASSDYITSASHQDKDHHSSKGGGQEHHEKHYEKEGEKENKGYKSDHHHDKTDHGKHDEHHKASHHQEEGGHEKENHDKASHYKKHHEAKKGHKSAKFGEKKGHKKGHKTKGYHNKFHKDEYHREHKFYDDYNKSGHHSKHGDYDSKHKSQEGEHKKGGSHKSGHHDDSHGKKHHEDKGSKDHEDKGFEKKDGHEEHHSHHLEYAKDGDNHKGKHYGYAAKH